MLTLTICLLVSLLICIAWWKDDSKGWAWIVVAALVIFGGVFPVGYGARVAGKQESCEYLAVSEINGNYYYLRGDTWEDVLEITSSITQATIPVVQEKGGN
jgi:hypothetical protein